MLYTAYRRIFLITAMLSTLIVVSISGDIGFWMATWGAGTFVIKLGDSIVSCNGPHKGTLKLYSRCFDYRSIWYGHCYRCYGT